MPLSFEDPSIVFDVQKGMILEASAGSGKTTILTERWLSSFLSLILWEGYSVSSALQSMVALTFTKKAATEMKTRIKERMKELWEDEEELIALLEGLQDYRHPIERTKAINYLHNQKTVIDDLLSSAKIMTINAYVLQLLRAYPLELNRDIGLTPEESSYDVSASEKEAQLISLRGLLAELYPHVQAYFRLGVRLLGLTQWIGVLEQIRRLVAQYGSEAIREGLNNTGNLLYEEKILSLALSENSDREIFQLISPVLTAMKETLSLENQYKSLTKANATFYQAVLAIQENDLLTLFSKTLLGEYKLDKPVKDEDLNVLRARSYESYAFFIDNLYRVIIPLMLPISDLCGEELKKLQAEYGEISFGESEIVLLEALQNPPFLEKVQRNLLFFFADEYQDTSDLQKRIFNILIQNDKVVPFFVGDPKQSIYRFRKANVHVFAQTIQEFQERGYQHRYLNTNYRSASSHVQFINDLFLNIFANDTIEYKVQVAQKEDKGSFYYTEDFEHQEEKSLVKDKLQKAFGDALIMIQDLLKQGVNPGEIMVLFRNRNSILDFYRMAKIYDPLLPLSSSVRNILWDNSYIVPLLSFLKALIYPHHDLTVVELLKTPLFAKNDEEINRFLLKAQEEKKSLYEALDQEEYSIIREFLVLRDRIPLEELLSLLIKELHYEEYLDLISETGEARATLALFIDEAQKLQEKREMSLGDFIKEIEQQKNQTEEAEFSGEEGKTLRLMTIHAAKGLESPYVIYIHKSSSREKTIRYPIYHQQMVAFDFLGKGVIGEQLGLEWLKEETAEEKRLAYVALTRAQKTFIFCALPSMIKSEDKYFETQWASFLNQELIAQFPEYYSQKRELSVLPFKKSSLAESKDFSSYQERYQWLLTQEKNLHYQEFPQFLSVSLLLDAEFRPHQFYDQYIRHSFDLMESLRELAEEEFEIKTPSAKDIGILVHTLLQEFDAPPREEVLMFLETHHYDQREIFDLALSYAYGYWDSSFYQSVLKNSIFKDKERQVLHLLPHGMIMRATADLYVSSQEEQNIIVDYKLSLGKNQERYHRQLSYYAMLSERAGHKVDQIVLFSLKEGQEYLLPWDREQTEKQFQSAVSKAVLMLTKQDLVDEMMPIKEWKDTLF